MEEMDDKRIVHIIRLYKDDKRMAFARDYTPAEFDIAWDVIKAMEKMGVIDRFIIREVDDEDTNLFLKQ